MFMGRMCAPVLLASHRKIDWVWKFLLAARACSVAALPQAMGLVGSHPHFEHPGVCLVQHRSQAGVYRAQLGGCRPCQGEPRGCAGRHASSACRGLSRSSWRGSAVQRTGCASAMRGTGLGEGWHAQAVGHAAAPAVPAFRLRPASSRAGGQVNGGQQHNSIRRCAGRPGHHRDNP